MGRFFMDTYPIYPKFVFFLFSLVFSCFENELLEPDISSQLQID